MAKASQHISSLPNFMHQLYPLFVSRAQNLLIILRCTENRRIEPSVQKKAASDRITRFRRGLRAGRGAAARDQGASRRPTAFQTNTTPPPPHRHAGGRFGTSLGIWRYSLFSVALGSPTALSIFHTTVQHLWIPLWVTLPGKNPAIRFF